MTTDLFGSTSNNTIKLNPKWSISQYLSSPSKYSSSTTSSNSDGISENIKLELERAINEINNKCNRSVMDFDKIFKDLATRRKELKALLTELQATARPADLAALWGVESNLIVNQLRALENKQKIESERFKHIRDEKKLAKERSGPSTESNGNNNGITNTIITNSPLATSETLTATPKTQGINLSNIPSDLLVRSTGKFESKSEIEPAQIIEHKEKVPMTIPTSDDDEVVVEQSSNPSEPSETTAEQTVVSTPSLTPISGSGGSDGDIVVTTDLTGLNQVTINDITKDMNQRVQERLMHKDEIMNTPTITGHKLTTSLNTIYSKSVPHKEVLFVAPDGRYYTKAFTTDENGEYTKELTEFPLKSLTHINSISFNPARHTCQFYFYNTDNKEYRMVEDMSDAPQFYIDEWNKPKNDKYMLDLDTVNALHEAQ